MLYLRSKPVCSDPYEQVIHTVWKTSGHCFTEVSHPYVLSPQNNPPSKGIAVNVVCPVLPELVIFYPVDLAARS